MANLIGKHAGLQGIAALTGPALQRIGVRGFQSRAAPDFVYRP
jgi:hypothetical protein